MFPPSASITGSTPIVPTVEERQILDATDHLYNMIRNFRRERTVANLRRVTLAAQAVEILAYKTGVFKTLRAVQVYNPKMSWAEGANDRA